MEFIENNRDKRMNALTSEFEEPKNLDPLTEAEWKKVEDIGEEEDKEFLPYTYRIYANEPNADNAYQIATTLRNLFQYKMSIPWDEKTLEFEPDDWETKGTLAYMYSQCEEYEKMITTAESLLEVPKASEPDFRDEIYCMLADANYFKGDIAMAVLWQERILKESKNKELLTHTRKLKSTWEEFL